VKRWHGASPTSSMTHIAIKLRFHLKRARENGVTEAELIETITHLAFYCGWPKAMSAIAVAKETFKP